MNLFDRLVEQAMRSDASLGMVRPAVEKELLHHDILRELSRAGLLFGLTFIGGSCLRTCYGSSRLSEDLDFTGGIGFDPGQLEPLPHVLEQTLFEKYGLPVSVSRPVKEDGNVSTWKLRIETRQGSRDLPSQRIHIDICALGSHQPRPMFLRNAYGVDMSTDGLVVRAQSLEEILADKWVALALRPNRVQYRDLWDILWLDRRGVDLDVVLLGTKTDDRRTDWRSFVSALSRRSEELRNHKNHAAAFAKEMARFLPAASVSEVVGQPDFWSALVSLLEDRISLIRSG